MSLGSELIHDEDHVGIRVGQVDAIGDGQSLVLLVLLDKLLRVDA